MRKAFGVLATLLLALGLTVPAAAAPSADALTSVPDRTAISVHYENGDQAGTFNAHQPRPALSLSKLYLGYWVLYHGTPADKAQVEHMIRVSDDAMASQLDARYPQAIPEIISDFELANTNYSGFWGTSQTSVDDVARFISEIRPDPVAAPLLAGMSTAAPVAADGYAQNFGTATLPGAQGTKFGWSDDRSIHATVTFGPGWVAAASTHGSTDTLTADVQAAGLPLAPAVGSNSGEIIDRLDCLDPLGSSGALSRDIPGSSC